MEVWQLSSANMLVYSCTATATVKIALYSIVYKWLVGGKHVLPYLVIVPSRFLAKGWFMRSIECCTLLLVMGSWCCSVIMCTILLLF